MNKIDQGPKSKLRAKSSAAPTKPNIKRPEEYRPKVVYQATGLFVFIILGFFTYSNTLKSPFFFDDQAHIQKNPHIRLTRLDLKGIVRAGFKSPLPQRPVANISFALNYYLHRYNVIGYHCTNIIIHILTGIFLYLFVKNTLGIPLLRRRYDGCSSIAFFAALLWLVNPLQIQSVTYIVQRMNSLAAMFYILSLLLYVKGRLATLKNKKSWLWFAGCIFAGMLALGCKEIAATLPVFILLYEWYFFQELNSRWLKRSVPYVIGVFIIFGLAGLLYLGLNPLEKSSSQYERWGFTLTERVLTQSRVVIYYITLLAYPHPGRLNLDHDFALSHSLIDPPITLLCIVAVIGLLALAIYTAKRQRLLSFCILWFFGNLAIESSVIPLDLMYEHRLYLPSMLVFPAIVVLAWHGIKQKWARALVLCIAVLPCCIWTYERNNVWSDSVTLWKDCADKSPEKPRPHYNLANSLYEEGSNDEAIRYYTKTLQLDPNRSDAHFGFGTALLDQGRINEAINHFTDALRLRPNYAQAHHNMGIAFQRQNNFNKALEQYNQALRINPRLYQAFDSLATLFYQQGEVDKAIAYWTEALRLKPDWPKVLDNLAAALYLKGKSDKAIAYWTEALRLEPDWPKVLNNLAWVLATHKDAKYRDSSEALRLAKLACELTEYKQLDLLDTLAAAYAAAGRFSQATETAEKAVQSAVSAGKKELAQKIQSRLQLYKTGQSYHESPATSGISPQIDQTTPSPVQDTGN